MPGFLGPVAAGLGAKALSGLFGKKKKKEGGSATRNRYMEALNPQEERADRAEDYYLEGITSFDPREALGEYGEAAYGDFRRNLDLDVERLGGASVGAGRLDTGYYDLDQGELVSDMANRYQRAIAGRALDASGQRLDQLGQVGQYGQGARNTYLDLLAGELDRETADKNAKKRMWSDLIGSGLGAAGTILSSRG